MKRIIPAAAVLLIAAIAVFLLATNALKPEEKGLKSVLLAETAAAEGSAAADTPTANPEGTAAENEPEQTPEEKQEQPFLVQITKEDPSIAYVLVRMPNPVGLLPLPQEGEYTKTIRVNMPDGSEYVNVLHVTPNGFRMEDANCEGHDCVNQGEVTLENREERILWNMVICLPHQLSAELITRKEAEQLLEQ